MQDGRHGVTFGITPTHTILFVQLGAYFVQICLVSVIFIFISSLDFTKLSFNQVNAFTSQSRRPQTKHFMGMARLNMFDLNNTEPKIIFFFCQDICEQEFHRCTVIF